MRIEINNLNDRIRDKIGVDSVYLPDSILEQPDIITVAEANIISQVPTYASLEDDARVYLESAVVLECCILLCSSMAARLPRKESGPHASHELGIDWDKRKSDFLADRDRFIGMIQDIIGISSPTISHFTVTFPRRW